VELRFETAREVTLVMEAEALGDVGAWRVRLAQAPGRGGQTCFTQQGGKAAAEEMPDDM